jgi:hypothetical protein
MENYIFEVENTVSGELCDEIIKKFESDHRKEQGQMSRGVDTTVKKSTDIRSGKYKDWFSIGEFTAVEVVKAIKHYLNHLKQTGLNKNNIIDDVFEHSKIGFPNIQRTDQGGYYKWHIDETINNRLLTYIIYLNDVEEGCGGTTDFSCGKSVLPKRGKILVFPATWNYIHTGKELKKGVKYIATGFIFFNETNK